MKKRIIIIISVLLAITAVITGIYMISRDKVAPGSILIISDNGKTTVRMEDLTLTPVKGSITNKKGETKEIDAEGYRLTDIPVLTGITGYADITVYADDEYSATVSAEDMSDPDKAWLIKSDESIRLIVFGDSDSKRDVKNVVRIVIR